MRESQIERYLTSRVKLLGGDVRKVKWLDRRGAPDRLVLLPMDRGLGQSIFVELKAPGKLPTIIQQREHMRMRSYGLRVVVIDSVEGVDALIR